MRWSTRLLLAANVVALLGLVAAPLMVLMTGFLFDAPGSVHNPLVWALAASVWSYPFTVGIGGLRALWAYRRGDVDSLPFWTCVTYSSLAAFLVLLSLAACKDMAT